MSGKIIAYVRVSTADQNEARQIKAIEEKYTVDRMFTEKVSAKDMNRPKLQDMLDYIRDDDIVVVSELSRIARNMNDLNDILNQIKDKGAYFVAMKENINTKPNDDSDYSLAMTNLLINIMGSLAQFERELIRERQKEGIEIAKKLGKYKGRKKIDYPKEWKEIYIQYKTRKITANKAMEILNLKRNTFYKLLKEYEESQKDKDVMQGQLELEAKLEPTVKVTKKQAKSTAPIHSTNTTEQIVEKEKLCKSSSIDKAKEPKELGKEDKVETKMKIDELQNKVNTMGILKPYDLFDLDETMKNIKIAKFMEQNQEQLLELWHGEKELMEFDTSFLIKVCLQKFSVGDTIPYRQLNSWLKSKEIQRISKQYCNSLELLPNLLLLLDIKVTVGKKLVKRFYTTKNSSRLQYHEM